VGGALMVNYHILYDNGKEETIVINNMPLATFQATLDIISEAMDGDYKMLMLQEGEANAHYINLAKVTKVNVEVIN
jgi:hypothetical protein